MSTTTDKLALFKYDPSTDGAQTFNIKKALNDNWDKLDDAVKEILITLANKAPGGYGLGNPQGLTDDDDINARHGNGCYTWGRIVPQNVPPLLRTEKNYMYMCEFGDSSAFTQIIGCVLETSPGLIQRQVFTGTGGKLNFGTWEWINPPMVLGDEYRTTERYLGKPVYCKVVYFGALPNNSGKYVSISSGVEYTIQVDVINATGSCLTGYGTISNVSASPGNILISTTDDMSDTIAYCYCKYTKTTD